MSKKIFKEGSEPPLSLSDNELVKLLNETNESKYFGILYDRYSNLVYNKCLRFVSDKQEAQDMTHDLFIKLYMKLRLFEGKSEFSTWLYSFTYNFCINHLQRKVAVKKELMKELNEANEIVPSEIDDSEIYQLKSDKLKIALERIDPKDKLILLMKYQDDFTIKEMVAATGLGESAVKMRINRAKKRVLDEYNKLEL
jgi:RNA polymerase sigma factor (sigma-70 family)